MSNAISGVGTKFRRWNPTSSGWEDIAEIKEITGPGKSRDTIDVTSLDSVEGYREFIAGFRNPGTVQLSMNFTRAGYDLMNEDFEDDTLKNYEIVLPDAAQTSFEFEGLVTELPLTIPAEAVTSDVTIQISGKVTVNDGANSSAP